MGSHTLYSDFGQRMSELPYQVVALFLTLQAASTQKLGSYRLVWWCHNLLLAGFHASHAVHPLPKHTLAYCLHGGDVCFSCFILCVYII
jgi:hypothetical protein